MTETPDAPLRDEDINTGAGAVLPDADPTDADGVDGGDADGTDGGDADGTDGTSS
jgi:hypothetical protein